MGKQIRFYTLPLDEVNLVDFVFSLPNTYFINGKTTQPEIEVLDKNLILDPTNVNLRHIYVWNKSMPIPQNDNVEIKATIYNEEKMDFVETGEIFYSVSTNAPIIEFSRSFLREDNKLVQGRMWCDFYRLVDNSLEYKGDDFRDLFEALANWIKKNFQKIKGVDGYFGEEALEWYKSGGKIFS